MATKARKSSAPAKKAPGAPKNRKRDSSAVAERRVHTPEVAGSTPAPASSPDKPDNLPSDSLNPRQRAFVVEYLRVKNATQAYARVYGCTEAAARRAGHRLLTHVDIRTEVDRLEREQLTRIQQDTGITLERTLREIARLAFYDPRKLLDAKGNPKPLHELDDDTAAAIQGLDVQQIDLGSADSPIPAVIKKYKLATKPQLLDMLMKHQGGYKEDNTQKVDPLLALLNGRKPASLPIVADPPGDEP